MIKNISYVAITIALLVLTVLAKPIVGDVTFSALSYEIHINAVFLLWILLFVVCMVVLFKDFICYVLSLIFYPFKAVYNMFSRMSALNDKEITSLYITENYDNITHMYRLSHNETASNPIKYMVIESCLLSNNLEKALNILSSIDETNLTTSDKIKDTVCRIKLQLKVAEQDLLSTLAATKSNEVKATIMQYVIDKCDHDTVIKAFYYLDSTISQEIVDMISAYTYKTINLNMEVQANEVLNELLQIIPEKQVSLELAYAYANKFKKHMFLTKVITRTFQSPILYSLDITKKIAMLYISQVQRGTALREMKSLIKIVEQPSLNNTKEANLIFAVAAMFDKDWNSLYKYAELVVKNGTLAQKIEVYICLRNVPSL